jgi:hypothetical protein
MKDGTLRKDFATTNKNNIANYLRQKDRERLEN